MNKFQKHIAALNNAAKKTTDPVMKAKILYKIRKTKINKHFKDWLAQ